MAKKRNKDDKLDLIISEIGKLKSKIKVLAKANAELASAIAKTTKEKLPKPALKKSGPAKKSTALLARKRPVLVKPTAAPSADLRATSK